MQWSAAIVSPFPLKQTALIIPQRGVGDFPRHLSMFQRFDLELQLVTVIVGNRGLLLTIA